VNSHIYLTLTCAVFLVLSFDVGNITASKHLNLITNFKITEDTDQTKMPSETVDKPEFCHGLGCPEFKIVNTTSEYEERLYKKSNWVSTTLLGMDLDDASGKMFMRLFGYISGNNVRKEKIAMTAPVIDRIIPGQGPACENNFTMSFFMDPVVTDPPQPTEKDVFLSSLPEQRVYVKYFGGFAKKEVWLENALALGDALTKDGKKFNKDHFFSAGYDSPFKLFNRHNEIWFLAE